VDLAIFFEETRGRFDEAIGVCGAAYGDLIGDDIFKVFVLVRLM